MKVKPVASVSVLIILAAAVLAIALGATGYTPSLELRPLAEFYLKHCLNPFKKEYWAASPEAVTSMLWDYRGLDTVYETTVFFLAIIGSVAVFRFAEATLTSYKEAEKGKPKAEEGLSLIVRVITRIVFVLIVALSAAIALHGHLTPGGGFQAGSIFAVAPLLAIAAFSRRFLEELGLTKNKCLAIRTTGLLAIALIALIPLAFVLMGFAGSFIIQNQPKPWALHPVFPGFPVNLGPIWLAGTLILFNIAEYLTVASGFTLLFILLALPEEFFRRLMGK